MRNPTALLGLVIVLGSVAISLVAWLLLAERVPSDAPESASAALERRRDSPAVPAEPLHFRRDPATLPASAPPEPGSSGPGDGRSEAPPPVKAPEPQGIEDARFAPQPAIDFSWKYARVERAELERAHLQLTAELSQRAKERIERHFAAADFEVLPLEGRTVDDMLGELKPPNLLGEARPSSPSEGAPPDSIHLVLLPREAHPDLYALLDELRWLEAKLGH